MKSIGIFILNILLPVCLLAQGINFQQGSWSDITRMALSENKMIYLDVYTTWCGPCKMLEKNIFPDQEVGNAYNSEFINYKIDAEKGEGIGLAKKYQVSGYPTGLFLSPDGETIIYKAMGYTDKQSFIQRATVAIQERKDTMTWDHYMVAFKKGKTSKTFLEAFIQKAGRLQKNDDLILDAYIKSYVKKGQPDIGTLQMLYENTHTLDNNSVDIIFRNATTLHNADSNFIIDQWMSYLTYPTMEKAINNKDEKILNRLMDAFDTYHINDNSVSGKYFYKSTYYDKTGQVQKSLGAYTKESAYLMQLPQEKLTQINKAMLAETIDGLKSQLKAMHVPDSAWNASIAATIAQHPEIEKFGDFSAAMRLNEAAWAFVKNKVNDKQQLGKAMEWSQKSMDLLKDSPSWPTVTDTYANLLYLSGNKDKAVQMEQEAVDKADANTKTALQATLDKMANGTL